MPSEWYTLSLLLLLRLLLGVVGGGGLVGTLFRFRLWEPSGSIACVLIQTPLPSLPPGGLYIKFGQQVAAVPVLPPVYYQEFRPLYNEAPNHVGYDQVGLSGRGHAHSRTPPNTP